MHLQLNVRREVLFLFLYIFLSNMALINEGATQGYSAVVLPILMSNTSSLTLNKMEILFFASTVAITPLIGSFICLITMHYGRRCTMIVCGVNFSLGWLLIASSYNVAQLFIGRVLTGISIGLASPSIEIYLAEISIPAWREFATITPNIGVSVGVLLVYFLGFVAQNNWRLIAAFFVIPSITLVLCNIFFLRESPMWLLLKGRKEAAKIALLQIRGLFQETIEFQEEFTKMVNYNASTNDLEMSENCQIDSSLTTETGKKSFLTNTSNKLKNIKRIILLPEVWKPIVILNFFFFFQRFSGTYVIIYYCVDIISRLNITIDPFLITVIVGIIQVTLNIISACCSMRIGRRSISIVSGTGMSISLGVLAVYLQFFEYTGIVAVPLICILSYVALGAYGFFSMPWSMIPELYPTKYINFLGPLTVMVVLLYDYIATQLYPIIVTYDRNGTIYFYCLISIIATIFLIIVLPETRGKTKTQIEEAFRDKLQIDETFKKIEDAC
ncbi:PREDICTED: facilitated trehalose transporter Tret1-like [Trachymyrmex septentrionalis]|uniref:facilitated trehalose transporter Tret1-like n=1 Tax=Trachymyrmex septentrionalis TaxID=34720 RepID=UPI00084F0BE1|nr:PREDICTED: facilitated trehalose transporter Tret1-like [Trachymyrmex septentrionalis]XP_018351591.1 PREDICTED: facilitated trehalose transporter Tret1-like [Trachymyrmex septentrionalis]XP_018351592.1 PREDICTED: facilitated trehalose transporter Tret1-like [Trachymyrmex septentrionalis]